MIDLLFIKQVSKQKWAKEDKILDHDHVPALRRPTRATKPALIGATDLPEPHYKCTTKNYKGSNENNTNLVSTSIVINGLIRVNKIILEVPRIHKKEPENASQ